MARAADGAAWIADTGCRRLIHVTPDGQASAVALGVAPVAVAADAAGGAWFAPGGHVDASGTVTRLRANATDVAVAPDGTAWFATGRCALIRSSGGPVRAPIPARRLAFDPTGGLLLVSRAVLAHGLAGRCDDRAPSARVRVSARTLRIVVRERAAVEGTATRRGERRTFSQVVSGQRGGTIRVRLPQRWTRGRLTIALEVSDRDGNIRRLRVTR